MTGWLKKYRLYLFSLLILVFITYANSLNNAFLSDDLAEIARNPKIGSFSSVIAHPFGFIRPLLYFITFNIAGLNQVLFRLINILFHLGSVFVVFALFQSFFSQRVAFVLAAIFAVHPALSEGIVWISGGMYPQYTFFFLLSLLLYILSKENKKLFYYSIFSYLAAFLSHPQMPLALFLIFPLYELSFGNFKKNWKKSIPYFAISMVYVLVALSSLPERETTLKSVHYQEGGIDNIFVLVPIAITSYFELIFFPKTLTLYHSELNFDSLNFMTRALITSLFFGLTLFSFKKNKFIFFWFSLFVISLLPTLTPFRLTWIVAERYIYLGMVGILAVLGLGVDKLLKSPKTRAVGYIILAVVLLIFCVRTIMRNIDWKNEDNLWIATGKTSPSSPNNHNNLGDVYGRLGNKEAALKEFQTAIALKPNYGDAYHNLGNTYRELGQLDKAMENYQKALEFNPNLWQSYQNIASIYYQNKQYDKALENMQKALQINPNDINLVNNLGLVYLGSGDKQKAKEIFNMVLSADPQNQFAAAGLNEASK